LIFEKSFEEAIQKAIDTKDYNFFKKRFSYTKREPKNVEGHSFLMLSAHNAHHLNKIDELDCDGVILNIEDGVAPEFKKIALYAAALFIDYAPKDAPRLIVRINSFEDGGDEEIAFLNNFYPDAIRIPKIKDENGVKRALKLIKKELFIHFSIETKEAFKNIASLRVEERIEAFYLGILDLLCSLNLPQSLLKVANPTITAILTKFLLDSLTTGVYPISFVYQDFSNLEEFEEWCRFEKELGFRAKGVISPKQAEVVKRVFGVEMNEIKKALYIKQKFEAMAQKGVTGFKDDKYGFIDEPIYKDALNLLKKAADSGQIYE